MSDDRAVRLLLRLIAAALLLLIVATWPLWTPPQPLPQIPWLAIAARLPPAWDWIALAAIAAGALLQFDPRGRGTVCGAALMSSGLAAALLVDQQRLQPWAYEYLLVTAILALQPRAAGLRCCRWLIISIYAWSAVSKLDAAYLATNGRDLLFGLLQSFGLQPGGWGDGGFRVGPLLFPLGELAVALSLAIPRFRRIGLVLSAGMHLLLLWVLGPFGLRHEPAVLIWNAAFIPQNWLLFRAAQGEMPGGWLSTPSRAKRNDSSQDNIAGEGLGVRAESDAGHLGPSPRPSPPIVSTSRSTRIAGKREAREVCRTEQALSADCVRPEIGAFRGGEGATPVARERPGRAARVVTLVAVAAPVLEWFGWWDHWPAWGVYASRPAQVVLFVEETAFDRLPPSLQAHAGPPEPLTTWRPVLLDRWCLAELNCPLNPQQRYRLAIVAALGEQHALGDSLRVRLRSAPNRWTGQRAESELTGVHNIRAACNSYWINTRPRAGNPDA